MQKRVYIPVIIILLITSFVFLVPKLLDLDTVRSKVAEVMSAKSGWQIDADKLDWYWLPTPHFSLRNTTLSKNDIRLALPETRIFPLWRSLLKNKIELSEVKLIKPELQIESFANSSSQIKMALPQARITVKDGTIVFSEEVLVEYPHLSPLSITKIDATINLTPEHGEFQLVGESSYFNFLEMDGSFTPDNLGFKFDYEINGLKFHALLPALNNKNLLPVESAISLRGNIMGNGTESFEASVDGDMPCFVSPSDTESFLLDCGSANFTITKDSDGFSVDIEEFKLKNPGLVLSGEIAKIDKGENPEPVWLINLSAEDLDLTAIRKGVLTLWGNNHIAQTVCDIVLGGRASKATYYFKAPVSGFKSIQQMKINVDIEEADIHPPATPLFLEKARGTIEISNGYLSGKGLSTRLGSSSGENCSLFIDLANRERDFKLELDIETDLAPLPEILYEVVHHSGFRQRLLRFSDVTGRTAGHLSIGPTLNDPKVEVHISSINGGAKYDSLPHAFRIRSGSFDILPKGLAWRGIKGVIGPHTIRGTTGKISWDEDLLLEIESAQVTFDSAVLLNELRNSSSMPDGIVKAITAAEGIVDINKATLVGKLNEPDNWQYSLDITTSGSRWTSPLLPHPIFAERVRARINQNSIDLISGKIWFLEQPLLMQGSFSHNNFNEWQFWTILSGTIREPLADWVREKQWIPETYFPKIPCTLDKLKIQWDLNSLKLSGGIAAGMGGITSPSVRLQLESNEKQLKISNLIISSPEEQGHLTLDYLKKGKKRVGVSWQGFVNSETASKLLNYNILQAERLEGDFFVKHSIVDGSTGFTGWAKAYNLAWLFNKSRQDIIISELNITGEQKDSILINQAEVAIDDEKLNLRGQISLGSDNVTFKLDLDTEKTSSKTTKKIIADLKSFSSANQRSNTKVDSSPGKVVKGVLNFKSSLYTSMPDKNEDSNEHSLQYVLSPANGFITIDSALNLQSLDLKNSNFCGLDISGSFNANDSNYESSLVMFTDHSNPPLFEDVMPCLGFNNTFIDGGINLDINLKGMGNTWQSGNAYLFSDNGYIRQLGLLSKVFRVVNLRDIFSGTDMPDFAGDGFAYSKIDISSHVENNILYIDTAFIDGEGLNIFARGTINLADWSINLTLMLAPLKTMDAIITNIPLIGKVVGGTDKAVISIPVSLKGDLRDPKVTVLPPGAIGEGFLNLVANAFMMPFQIISPLLPESNQ